MISEVCIFIPLQDIVQNILFKMIFFSVIISIVYGVQVNKELLDCLDKEDHQDRQETPEFQVRSFSSLLK